MHTRSEIRRLVVKYPISVVLESRPRPPRLAPPRTSSGPSASSLSSSSGAGSRKSGRRGTASPVPARRTRPAAPAVPAAAAPLPMGPPLAKAPADDVVYQIVGGDNGYYGFTVYRRNDVVVPVPPSGDVIVDGLRYIAVLGCDRCRTAERRRHSLPMQIGWVQSSRDPEAVDLTGEADSSDDEVSSCS